MKFTSVITVLLVVFSIQQLTAQQNKESAPAVTSISKESLFKKGMLKGNLIPNFHFKNQKIIDEYGNNKTANTTSFQYRGMYNVVDHVGVVLGIYGQNECTFYDDEPDFKNVNSTTIFEFGAQGGGVFGGIPLQLEATVGLGSYRLENAGSDDVRKMPTTAYQVNVGTYIDPCGNGLFINPTVGYGGFINDDKDSDFKNETSGFYFGVNLIKPMGHSDYNFSMTSASEKGTFGVQFLNAGGLGTGTNTKTFSPMFSNVDKIFTYGLRLDAYYNFIDDLAIGLGTEIDGLNTKQEDVYYELNTSNIYLTPKLRLNMPVEGPLNNLFVEGGAKLGWNNTITRYENFMGQKEEDENKWNSAGWEVGLGYNLSLGKGFMLTALGTLAGINSTNADADLERDINETNLWIGLSYFH